MHRQKIRSFIVRSRQFSEEQQQHYEQLLQCYGLKQTEQLLNFEEVFTTKQPVVIEIGFGMGNSLLTQAIQNPQINYLGVEVHRPGLFNLLKGTQSAGLTNLKIVAGDAIEILRHMIADQSLAGIQIFFPDPWPKRKHHKRRLLQSETVALLAQKLCSGGFLHVATDWQDYAQAILQILTQEELLQNSSGSQSTIARPLHRPITKYEQKAIKEGRAIADLMFLKKS
jgi:tRNA (guanine-N7-)-methyltransferase